MYIAVLVVLEWWVNYLMLFDNNYYVLIDFCAKHFSCVISVQAE